MSLANGRYLFGSDTGVAHVNTARQGVASAAGHDLLIEVTRWGGSVDLDVDAPENSRVAVSLDVRSFEVREGTGGVRPLTDRDRRDIKTTLETKILDAARYPSIAFVSREITVSAADIRIDGELTIRGVSRPVEVRARRSGDDSRFMAAATVVQTRWNIAPYKGLLGALKVADPIDVSFDFVLTS